MPLVSTTLAGSAALQACLVRDSAHVTPGARGPHVALIQKCLLILESSRIAAFEIRAQSYGATTAAAVLAYKRARQIINRSYQQQADNIVGKMTIARLDEDMARVEGSRTLLVKCPQGGGGGGRARSVADRAGTAPVSRGASAPVSAPVQQQRLLTIHIQQTDSADVFAGGAFLNALLVRARQLLRPHGFSLSDSTGPPIPWPDGVVHTQFPVDRFALRNLAVSIAPGADSVLRVIICPFDQIDPINGITDGGLLNSVPGFVPKFSLINIARRNPDAGTLLHEMIHASFPGPSPLHDNDPRSVYSIATSRDRLSDDHASRLASAFFARRMR